MVSDATVGNISSSVDENGKTTAYQYDSLGRLTKVIAPESNSTEYVYDARGNVVQTIAHAKPGSGLADIVTSAAYDAVCSNPKTCNQPNTTTDGRGGVTTYTYDPGTGLPTSITRPVGANGIAPKVVFDYTAVTSPASYGDGANTTTLTLLNKVRTCRTASECAGTGNEIVVETGYGGASLNFLPTHVAKHAGNNAPLGDNTPHTSSLTIYGYDDVRNINQVTDPVGGVTKAYYNPGRELFWTLSPDPDTTGGLLNRMTVTDRNPDGSVSAVRVGTGNANGGGFVELQRTNYGYDAAGRKTWDSFTPGGPSAPPLAFSEYSYDALGRLDCTNQRMNPGNWSNVRGRIGVCAVSEIGAYGPDRITRNEYDPASRLTKVWTGYGITNYQTSYNYTNNGKLERIYDPKGNATTYSYDGFDRPKRTCYANTTCAGTPADYEEAVWYDNNGNVTRRRLRDGNTTDYAFDALDRLTQMNPLAADGCVNNNFATGCADKTKNYTYDGIGNMLTASIATFGTNVSYSYDGIGRLYTEYNPWAIQADYRYDAAGRLTRLGYADGYYVDYDYFATGEMYRVREMGATSGIGVLAQIGLDQLGRRVNMIRGNGTTASWTYDQAGNGGWPTQLAQTIGGSASVAFGFSYNPAGQITSRTANNESYAWQQSYSVYRTYDVNALNQYTRSGSVNLGYDPRGNLTSAPTPAWNNADQGAAQGYVYNTENQLVGKVTGASTSPLYYDATGRLSQDDAAGRRFGYAGSRRLFEKDFSGNTVRRYVYGPDEAPLVWYDGTGTTNRHWLIADERGSVIADTDNSGNRNGPAFTYDEYGIPATTNATPFGYTGQAWNSTLGMWYYKARIYSPTLGRFMQTDPIGYADGLNWYNYVGGDPVNKTDPSGLQDIIVTANRNPASFYSAGNAFISGADIEIASHAQTIPTCGNFGLTPEECTDPRWEFSSTSQLQQTGDDGFQLTSGPKDPKVFQPLTNRPQYPPKSIPEGWRVRPGPATPRYPNGYWVLEKPMGNGGWQRIDPSTMKPGTMGQTHIPNPASPVPSPSPSTSPSYLGRLGVVLWALGIIDPDPLY